MGTPATSAGPCRGDHRERRRPRRHAARRGRARRGRAASEAGYEVEARRRSPTRPPRSRPPCAHAGDRASLVLTTGGTGLRAARRDARGDPRRDRPGGARPGRGHARRRAPPRPRWRGFRAGSPASANGAAHREPPGERARRAGEPRRPAAAPPPRPGPDRRTNRARRARRANRPRRPRASPPLATAVAVHGEPPCQVGQRMELDADGPVSRARSGAPSSTRRRSPTRPACSRPAQPVTRTYDPRPRLGRGLPGAGPRPAAPGRPRGDAGRPGPASSGAADLGLRAAPGGAAQRSGSPRRTAPRPTGSRPTRKRCWLDGVPSTPSTPITTHRRRRAPGRRWSGPGRGSLG